MRWPLAMLGSRVAWRMFARFALASFLPLAALSALFLLQVVRALERAATEELDGISRAVGQSVFDKLLGTLDLLVTLPGVPSANPSALGLTGAALIEDGRTTWLGEPFDLAGLPSELDPARPALWVLDDASGPRVAIASVAGAATVVGLVDPAKLEAAAALAGRGVEVCVFGPPLERDALFCAGSFSPIGREALAGAPPGAAGHLSWVDHGEDWRAAHWELFVPSRFAGESWRVVAAAPRSAMLQSLTDFNRVAPQTLALVLAVIALISVSLIRRTLNPLRTLVAATKRIAAQQFDTRVEASGNDEFAALGRALNDMTQRLGRQFSTLTTLAEIDRLILASESIDEVIEAVLTRAAVDLPAFELAVLLGDHEDDTLGRLYRRTRDGKSVVALFELSKGERDALAAAPGGTVLRPDGAYDGQRISLTEWPNGGVFAVPILRGQSLAGALLASLPDGSAWHAHDVAPLRELAGRFAVAITSAEREHALIRRAHFDPLTGLPNRRLCHERLEQALGQAHRDGRRVAVLFIDIDAFKSVNDLFGHGAGDELLRQTALRLSAAVRDTGTVGRFGGDEYLVILPALQDGEALTPVLERVTAALQRPFELAGRESFVTGSIGVTLFPDDGSSAEELVRKADTAMYTAKTGGRARCVYFAKEMDLRVQERLALSNDLRRASERGELFLVYQPQVRLDGHEVIGVEALLRWRHPTRGLISPALFVPILEETGLIEKVGAWVLHTALADLATWRSAGLPIERVGVNVTARQLLAPGFVDGLAGSLAAAGVGAPCLELELTETTLISDFPSANARLAELKSRGVRIAVDDFGTGYSSLGYLNELTFDALKIDRAFVVNLPTEKSLAIVKAIVAVAHALDKEVVAEGIEGELQRLHLARVGCDLGQGYFFSQPLNARELANWLSLRLASQAGPRPRSAA
ncbi:MAG TPA: EAL domain-containing protein [Gammaproteobacteria bacterium]|nr:EAL domain-containing protein [Gammaproteobacteria bacterium]